MKVLNLQRRPGRLPIKRKLLNEEVYGVYFPTYSQRIRWIHKNKPREAWNRFELLAKREHLLDLRECYPQHKALIGKELRKMPAIGYQVMGSLD